MHPPYTRHDIRWGIEPGPSPVALFRQRRERRTLMRLAVPFFVLGTLAAAAAANAALHWHADWLYPLAGGFWLALALVAWFWRDRR